MPIVRRIIETGSEAASKIIPSDCSGIDCLWITVEDSAANLQTAADTLLHYGTSAAHYYVSEGGEALGQILEFSHSCVDAGVGYVTYAAHARTPVELAMEVFRFLRDYGYHILASVGVVVLLIFWTVLRILWAKVKVA